MEERRRVRTQDGSVKYSGNLLGKGWGMTSPFFIYWRMTLQTNGNLPILLSEVI